MNKIEEYAERAVNFVFDNEEFDKMFVKAIIALAVIEIIAQTAMGVAGLF